MISQINKYHLKIAVVFICVITILTTTGYFLLKLTKSQKNPNTPKSPVTNNNEDTSTNNSSFYNILLLGYGGQGHDGSSLSDVLIVVNLNHETKKVTLISVPRDLWVEMPIRSDISEYHKINEAYAIGTDDRLYPLKQPLYKGEFGGGEMAKKAVADVIGMPIDYFIAIDFNSFKTLVDKVGKIEVEIPVTFDDHFYPIKGLENESCGKSGKEIAQLSQELSGFELEKQFECRYEHLHFDKGKQIMDGETALKFVRSRHSSQHGGDFARSQRQFALLVAIKNKLLLKDILKNLDETYDQLSSLVKTDINLDLIRDNTDLIGNPSSYPISYLGLTEDNVLHATQNTKGQFILVSKEGIGMWKTVREFIENGISNTDN